MTCRTPVTSKIDGAALSQRLAKTVTGRAMQAVAQNTESATVLGIDVPRMVFYTFAINALMLGLFISRGFKNGPLA